MHVWHSTSCSSAAGWTFARGQRGWLGILGRHVDVSCGSWSFLTPWFTQKACQRACEYVGSCLIALAAALLTVSSSFGVGCFS